MFYKPSPKIDYSRETLHSMLKKFKINSSTEKLAKKYKNKITLNSLSKYKILVLDNIEMSGDQT